MKLKAIHNYDSLRKCCITVVFSGSKIMKLKAIHNNTSDMFAH